MIKRLSIDLILLSLFFVLTAAAVSPLLAGICLEAGEKCEFRYLWEKADRCFDMAMMLDPLNAGNISRIGEVYQKRGELSRDNVPFMLKAEGYYAKAHRLNQSGTEYLMELAMAETGLFLSGPVRFGDRIGYSIGHIKDAVEIDPNSHPVNYDAGRNLLRIWDHITEEDRYFALDRLRHCLSIAPWYHWRIYPLIWERAEDFDYILSATPEGAGYCEGLYRFIENNGLWEHRKKVTYLLKKYKGGPSEPDIPKLTDEEKKKAYIPTWLGSSKYGRNEYKQGKMYWGGQAYTHIDLPDEEAIVVIRAKGFPAYDVWPYMIVELDDEEIGETYVTATEWRDYSFYAKTGGGTKTLKVTYANDGGDWKKGIDRNLFLGHVNVIGMD